MSTLDEDCGHSCSCGKGGCDDTVTAKKLAELDPFGDDHSESCGDHCGCDTSDDGFGDYMGEDSDRVMRERDRVRLQETMEKVGYVDGLTQGREDALQEGFDVGIGLGCEVGLVFGHLSGQIESWRSIAASSGLLARAATSNQSKSFSLDTVSEGLAGIASEVREAEKRFVAENLKDALWKPVYLTLLSNAKVVFAQLSLPEPAMAPGFRP